MQRLGQYSRNFPLFRKTQLIRFSGTLTSAKLNDTLHSRVMAVEKRILRRVKVTPVLDEWLEQGNQINPNDLKGVVKSLCESQRFDHALQVLEWIPKRGVFDVSSEYFASRLYLVEIHSGLREAEKFFKSIPENMRDDSLSFLSKPNPYYNMISLYGLLGERNMVEEIMRQMEENGVEHDKILTANNVLKAYASVPDVEAMEKFLMGLEDENPRFQLAWQTGISMAKAYLKGGSRRKAIEMLRRTEVRVDAKSKDSAYKVLMELYREAGAKQDESRLYRRINPNVQQGKTTRAYESKGGGCGGTCFYCGCGGGGGNSSGGGNSGGDDGGGGNSGGDDSGGGSGGGGCGGCGSGCGGCGSWD
ncbi:hypothetical protein EUTSA_v10009763mg [Eutrema salsugineum]|uniref:Pentacotripeptide-repeat region of PRORP domain-containing protein n=1 Tax=Eutrema salsugineum TaxID=72664 RepID=V4K8W5_EUTSA|nr:hypothetical protein EUTSA_v10009763mg [Eutrema salsugineum]